MRPDSRCAPYLFPAASTSSHSKTTGFSSISAHPAVFSCQPKPSAQIPTSPAPVCRSPCSAPPLPHLGARRGGKRPHVVREHRVRGQQVVHPRDKYLIGSSLADIQDVPQVLDLLSRAESNAEGQGENSFEQHAHGIFVHRSIAVKAFLTDNLRLRWVLQGTKSANRARACHAQK